MRFELALPAPLPQQPRRRIAADLKFTFGTPARSAEPLLPRGPSPRPAPATPVDLYSVGCTDQLGNPTTRGLARFGELARAVLYEHNPSHKGRSALLGDTGHCERFNAWSHLLACVAFSVFASLRQAGSPEGVAGAMTSAAAWSVVSVFLASACYHITAPDEHFAKVSRFIDFFSIYISIVLTSSADLAVVTRGFEDVPLITILDLPLAGLAVAAFFLLRRWHLATSETWVDNHVHEQEHGLFCRHHDDLHHKPLRSSTSLVLTASFILTFPVAAATVPDVAPLFLLLQLLAFAIVLLGMTVDNVLAFPNHGLLRGDFRCLAFPGLGFVINGHGVWHVLSCVSVALTVASREVALSR